MRQSYPSANHCLPREIRGCQLRSRTMKYFQRQKHKSQWTTGGGRSLT